MFAEEIFATPEAIWSSDDGTRILFASFNDTRVGTMTHPWFDSGTSTSVQGAGGRASFPETRSIRYPTPGTANPDVQLWIVDLTNTSSIQQWPVTSPIIMESQ